jgi:hypothetical protein
MDVAEVRIKKFSGTELIFVKALEHPTVASMKVMTEKVIKLSAKHKCKYLLIDGRKSRTLPNMIDIFMMGKDLTSSPNLLGFKIAITGEELILPNLKFFSNVAHNRGLNVEVFSEINSAKNWLLNK